MNANEVERLADLVTNYSLNVQRGNVVVVSGPGVAEPLLHALFKSALTAGALPVIRFKGDLYRETSLRTAGEDNDRWLNLLSLPEDTPVDRSIGVWAPEESGEPGDASVPEESVDLEEHHRQREFLRAAAEKRVRWTAVAFPTLAAARNAGMSEEEFSRFVVRGNMLDEPDPAAAWQALFERQQSLCDQLDRSSSIRFQTSSGSDLTMNVLGRKWINCGGHYNLPDGEVFTSPIEDSVNGVFVGDYPLLHGDHLIAGVRLEFRDGQVVDAHAGEGDAALQDLIATDRGASRVGEIALGLNSRITTGTKMSLIDEKIGGTFHLALGAAYPETGGSNDSLVHRDFVGDLREGGSVEVDGHPIDVRTLVLAAPHLPR